MFNDNKKASREIPAKNLAKAEAYFENWLKTAVLEEDDLLFQSLSEEVKQKNTQKQKRDKKRNKAMTTKNKIICITVISIVLLIAQLCSLTPYIKYQTYISSQNVPHSVVVERGYRAINEIGYYEARGKTITIEQIDYVRAFIQFGLTIGTAIFLCIWLYKKDKPSPKAIMSKSELNKRIEHLEKENQILKTFIRQNSTEITPPILDMEAITFADTEAQEAMMSKYNAQMIEYARQQFIREYVSKENGENNGFPDASFDFSDSCGEELEKNKSSKPLYKKKQNLFCDFLEKHCFTKASIVTLCVGYALGIFLCFFELPFEILWLTAFYPFLWLAISYGFKSKTSDSAWIATKVCFPFMLLPIIGILFIINETFFIEHSELIFALITKSTVFAITTSIVILQKNIKEYFG